MNDISQRVTNCFLNIFPDADPQAIPTATNENFPGWDSIAQVTLLASIAEEFSIELEMSDFEELVSFPLIVSTLEQRLGA